MIHFKLEALETRCLLTFAPAVSYPVGASPEAIAVGDFNGDGSSDMVTANTNSNTVSLLLNNGAGVFGAAQNFAVGVGPKSIAVGDFNGDGKLDFVAANQGASPNYDGSISVLLGNGDGTFQAEQSFGVGVNPQSIAVGDFNHDGNLDLAIANEGSWGSYYSPAVGGTVSVLLGAGDGAFLTAQNLSLPPQYNASPQHPFSVVEGDLNNDGKLDLAVTGEASVISGYGYYGPVYTNESYINVLLGNGTGTFATSSTIGPPSTTSTSLADFNGDGKLDLAVIDYGNTAVLFGNGDGTFQAPTYFKSPLADVVVAGDFNRDGKLDLATDAAVLLGNGDGTFQTAVADNLGYGSSLAAGDFSGDQFLDLAAAHPTSNSVSVSFNAANWHAVSLAVSGFLSPATAGAAQNFTVTVLDCSGNIAANYTGTIHFTSSDPQAVLPADYTFTASDAGVHTFSAALKTAGTQSISANDIASGGITGAETAITVNPAAASKFVISAPASVKAGVPFSLTITVEDAYGNVVTGYTGTIHFVSTDKNALLPADYTFTAGDQGAHTFTGLVLKKKGNDKITVTDTQNSSLNGNVTEYVQ